MNAASALLQPEQQNHRLGTILKTPARASVCGHENPPDAAFCGECGAALIVQPVSCSVCGHPNPATLKFCRGCGARQTTAPTSTSPPFSSLLAPSTYIAGRYQVQRLLGEGAKKRVYLAHDAMLNRDVALAVFKTVGLDEAGRMRIQREISSLSQLGEHPHIVTLYDAGEEQGSPYFISHYLPGGSIQDLLEAAEQKRLTLDHALGLTDQICQALEYAHQQGIIHRDLKPSNVWLTQDGVVKLGDFGLATSLDHSRFSLAGVLIGTAAYLPPEQLQGRKLDARSDLYSLGAMLYEMVAGRPPFIGDGLVSLISQHLNAPPVAPSVHNPVIPPTLDNLILQLLEKNPDQRPSSASAVRGLLQTIATTHAATDEHPIQPVTHALDRLASEVFVGREQEIDTLREQLEAALTGRGRAVILTGEPGIGKTRTAMELATYAQLRGARVLIGRCHEEEGMPSYWMWVHLMRVYVTERPLTALRTELSSGAAVIAQVITEVQHRLPDLPVSANQDPAQARFRFFDSFTQFVKNAARNQPLVLILDDLQWADTPSLLLLQFLVREIADVPLLLVATCRQMPHAPQSPLTDTLAAFTRAVGSQILPLQGLKHNEVARFIELTTGTIPSEQLITAVYEGTEGHPFFMTEIVRLLATETHRSTLSPQPPLPKLLPQSVRSVIERRLEHVSEDCRRLLTIAAMIGREFGLNLLETVETHEEHKTADSASLAFNSHGASILELLDEAVAARLITPAPQGIGRYSFSHALIHETLCEALPIHQQVQLQQQMGEAEEALYAARIEFHLEGLAHRFFRVAQHGGNADKAIDYSKRAGEHATTLLAYEDAVAHYERALQALELAEPDDFLRCELLVALGEAQYAVGNSPLARETFQHAAEIARRLQGEGKLSAATLLARAALGFSGEFLLIGVVDKATVSFLEEALIALGEEESPLRAKVLGRLAMELYQSAQRERCVSLSTRAVEMARRLSETSALATVLGTHRYAIWEPDTLAERLALTTEIVQLGQRSGRNEITLLGCHWRIIDRLEQGDVLGMNLDIEEHEQLAKKLDQRFHLWYGAVFRATQAQLKGRFEEGEQLAQQAFTLGKQTRLPMTLQIFGMQLFLLRRAQGRLHELEGALREFVERTPTFAVTPYLQAYFYSELGREAEARELFTKLKECNFTNLPRDLNWLVGLAYAAEVCSFLNDAHAAVTLYELLFPYATHNVVIGRATGYFGSVAYFLGLLAILLGRRDEAQAHFEAAMQQYKHMDAKPFIAQTQYTHARLLLTRDQPGDMKQAARFLAQALTVAQELGMDNLKNKIEIQLTTLSNDDLVACEEEETEGATQQRKESPSQVTNLQPPAFDLAGHSTPNIPHLVSQTPDPQPPVHSLFRHEGEYWTISHKDLVCRLKEVSGLHYIAFLLHHPNQEFHVMDLVHREAGDTPSVGAKETELVHQGGASKGLGDAGEALDPQARIAYKQRVKELHEELQEARDFNDQGRIEKLEEELAFLAQELAGAVGLGGRNRKAASVTERARVNVTRAIKAVIKKIAEQSPALELYFATTIKTGTFCSYTPDPRFPITWQF